MSVSRMIWILALAQFSVVASAKDYNVDRGHSAVMFEIRHLLTKARGQFKDFEGTFSFDEKALDKSKVDFTVKVASIDTNDTKRDDHLRAADFFDVEKFATMTFKSKALKAAGKGKYKLSGDLSLHGVTKPVTFDLEYLGSDKDPWGNDRASFSAAAKINRKDYGLVWNKTLESGRLLVGEDVDVKLEVEGTAVKAAAAGT